MSLIRATLAAAIAGSAIASPLEHLAKRKAFTIEQVPGGLKPAFPINVARTYAKYGVTLPEDIANAAARAAAATPTGSATANSVQGDLEYLTPVTVGTQILNLDLDTGSSDLWVYSTFQPASQTAGHRIYDPPKSSSSKLENGEKWNITYGDGSGANGILYTDQVTIGGITSPSQAVEVATGIRGILLNDPDSDGLVGLAWSRLNTVKPQRQNTFFDNISPQLAAPLFAVTLKHLAPGTYDFGFIDSQKYTGALKYVPLDTSKNSVGFWGFTMSGYSIGGSAVSGASRSAIVDTGTTLIYLPLAEVNAYMQAVPTAYRNATAGGIVFPCSDDIPSLGISINGQVATVPGSLMNYGPLTDRPDTCLLGLLEDDGLPFSILGDIFLKSQYVVFDKNNGSPRLGFAPQAGM